MAERLPDPAPVAVAEANSARPSVSGKSRAECIGPIALAAPSEIKLGSRKAELNGYRLSVLDPDADDSAVFGVLGSINEDSGENLVNLQKYLEFFESENVEAILVAGDVGESQSAIERVLEPLAKTGLPVFVVIGNRECPEYYNAAIAALQKKHPNLVDLGKVRHVAWDDADILSLPGYHDHRYIHCETGCQYFTEDIEALEPVAREAKNPVVLIAHGPPKGSAPTAVDNTTDAGNVGDRNLNALIEKAAIPFGIFANIKEAGGRATDLSGMNVLREGELADRLYLNPGPADAVAWAMNDGTQSVGMAAVLAIKGRQASHKIYRAKPLTAEEQALAQELNPATPDQPAAEAALHP